MTICPGIPRWTEGADADVPRKCSSNMTVLFRSDFYFAQEEPVTARLVLVVDRQPLACIVTVCAHKNVKFAFRETFRKRNVNNLHEHVTVAEQTRIGTQCIVLHN